MGDWQQYVDQIIHKFDYDTNTYTLENVCKAAAIYGHDGSCWAFTPEFPELVRDRKISLEGLGDAKEEHTIDEIECAIEAGKGNRSPSAAGIRLDSMKYMLTYRDDETGISQLVSPSGGAAIVNINTAVIIAIFDKDRKDAAGAEQNIHDTVDQVYGMSTYLKEQGY